MESWQQARPLPQAPAVPPRPVAGRNDRLKTQAEALRELALERERRRGEAPAAPQQGGQARAQGQGGGPRAKGAGPGCQVM